MERIILKMQYEIESCENRIDEEKDSLTLTKLKERMKTIKEFLHQLESELDHDNGMPQLRAVASMGLNGVN